MLTTLIQMFALIGLGLFWSYFNPGQINAMQIRKVLTDLVYYIFLPALVLNTLWQADLGIDSVKIATSAAIGVLAALLLSWLVCKQCKNNARVTGAVILAASFPNATYLGYPVLTNTLGEWAGPVAIQYDLFACSPLLLTLGIMIAAHYGDNIKNQKPLLEILKVPPLIAAFFATSLNILDIEPIIEITGLLSLMASVVIPVMLFVIGLALKQGFDELKHINTVIPISIIQLVIMPLIVFGSTSMLNLSDDLRSAIILEAAMPSMALGVVLCDRYGLNTGVYASAVTLTTLFSIISLPLWFNIIS